MTCVHSLGIAGAASLAALASGQIVFHEAVADSVVDAETRVVTSEFVYENIGDYPVTITKIKTSCGCTVAELEDRNIPPGTLGFVSATMKMRTNQDSSVQEITIQTDDQANPEYVLTISASVWRPISVRPASLSWAGEDRGSRTVNIQVNRDEPFFVRGIEMSGTGVDVALITIDPGRAYRLVVTPVDGVEVGARMDVELVGAAADGSDRIRIAGQIRQQRRTAYRSQGGGHAYPSIRKAVASRRRGS